MLRTVVNTLRSSGDAARLIGVASNFISDSNFINVLNQYDYNSSRNDSRLQQQLNLFSGVPGINEQISRWLSS
jgi:hypothetical protein